jgi:hypothetical protein
MRKSFGRWRSIALVLALFAIVLGGYALLPISGRVIVMSGDSSSGLLLPQMHLDASSKPMTLAVTDAVPWAHVRLTLDGQTIPLKDFQQNPGGTWTWRWLLAREGGVLVFYHDCHTGCIARGELIVGARQAATPAPSAPTKLGVVSASPTRHWHGRSGWDVELTYARLAERDYWGIDDLAARVHAATAHGLRVLVRVDYAQGQSIPPANDQLALTEYLQYLQRLARDARLQAVYGYIIGSNFNARDSNLYVPGQLVTPQWYARVFNGYGEAVAHTDNVVQTMRGENPHIRILVGPVQPWNRDQTGEMRYAIDAPWLNYMNTLVAALDEGARAKTAAGIALAAPDGFAIQAPSRPDAPELAGRSGAEEPRLDLRREAWGGAQAGFRVYRDWLAIINAFAATRGLPVYITSTNTFTPDQAIVPAQNDMRGWLTTALDAINQEPQIQSLCWFLDEDRSGDVRWDYFGLTLRRGRLIDAAQEFEALLR